ncbi:hypothetical protein JCM19238_2537 [Vibrio ponticus]|nr:hypothetical protein JCM19238_2537 [Vibrio ponticus]
MQDWPIIIANAITLMLASIILLLKIRDVVRNKKRSPLSA